MYGEYDSAKAKMVYIMFERCVGYTYCASEAEIDEWIENKYIVTLTNEMYFDKERTGLDSIQKQSRIVWNTMSPQIRQTYVNKV